jgi:hypothetical protein
MDIFKKTGINIANSVIVSGVTNTEADDEIIDHLRSYGEIKQSFTVTERESPLYKNLTVEFINAAALAELEPKLPYTFAAQSADFVIKLLRRELAAAATVEATPSPDYLQELKRISQQSGQSFDNVLKGMFDQISSHLGIAATGGREEDDDDEEEDDDEDDDDDMEVKEEKDTVEVLGTATETDQRQSFTSPLTHGSRSSVAQQRPRPTPARDIRPRIPLSGNELNPPEVQRVVVEHIVRRDDVNLQAMSSFRLRTFSGKLPKPQHEANYESWRSQIELLNADPSLAPVHITRRILESLLPPAADLVKSFGPNVLPATFLHVLDSAYATVEDGEELFAKYLNTLQDQGEQPSSYLQRLQLALGSVVKRGGIPAAEFDRYLLKQFCRGCWDNGVINKLQLEQKRDHPPPFSELLFMLRTEEDRQLAKETLMKKHIPSVRHHAKLQTHTTSAYACDHTSDTSAIEELKKQMLQLQRQMSALLAQKSVKPDTQLNKNNSKPGQGANRPKPWFCFKCGQDGHIVPNCPNPPNSSLVEEKRSQLKGKQQSWEKRKPSN